MRVAPAVNQENAEEIARANADAQRRSRLQLSVTVKRILNLISFLFVGFSVYYSPYLTQIFFQNFHIEINADRLLIPGIIVSVVALVQNYYLINKFVAYIIP